VKAQAAILRFSRAWAEASALALSQGKHAAEAVVRWFLGAVALGQAPRKTELELIARAGAARWLGALPFGRVVGLFDEAGVVTEGRGRKDSAKCAFASCVCSPRLVARLRKLSMENCTPTSLTFRTRCLRMQR